MSKLPSTCTQLSPAVLDILKSKFMNYEGTPFCFVETSHRSKQYDNLNTMVIDAIQQYFHAHDY